MDFLYQLESEKLLLFTLVLTRVTGLLLTAPIYGTTSAPTQVRALLAVTLTLLVMPVVWDTHVTEPAGSIGYIALVGGEFLIGAILGLGIAVLLAGMVMAGELTSRMGSLSMADIFDPTANSDISMFSQLLQFVAIAFFLGMGGHRTVMAGLLNTFQHIPAGATLGALWGDATTGADAGLLAPLAHGFVLLLSESFQLAVRASVPVVAALLLATMVLGLVSRTLPQMNVLAVGFGLNSLLTFGTFFLALGGAVWLFEEQVGPALKLLLEILRTPLPS
jgi:flagellar biosynthesis protein FliR